MHGRLLVSWNTKKSISTDVFRPLMQEIETITNNEYGKDEKVDIAIRVIADHLRAVAFSIADGQIPSNTGAGYVIRRILRRAVRYGFTFLGTKKPFIYQLVDTLTKQMGTAAIISLGRLGWVFLCFIVVIWPVLLFSV